MVPEAYILVGGRSSRFVGGDKPSALIKGKTLVENAADIVSAALPGTKTFLVARDEDQFVEEARRLGIDRINDRIPDRGPLGGLFSALAHCESEWLFLFACDLPLMTPSLVAAILPLCDPQYGVVIPRQADGRLQPLCAFYNVSETLPVVEHLLHRPDGSAALMSAVDSLEARIVESGEIRVDPAVWYNVNTIEDLAAASEIERKLLGRGEI
jgi:molybdopterin-guanine dinucleotide biosynthesis protein A